MRDPGKEVLKETPAKQSALPDAGCAESFFEESRSGCAASCEKNLRTAEFSRQEMSAGRVISL